jgi:antitoxin component YwqK of YwqJK toxin-antitoxin module
MKTKSILLTTIILLILTAGCFNKANKNSPSKNETSVDTTAVADTGYNGITQYTSGNRIVKEVTFKNGVRHGLMKTFYANGLLRQTFWYENGKIQDTARWYQEDGRVFRTTPYKDDSAHGIQTQYYRTGAIRARLEFINGIRTPFLEEFESNGKKVTGYPDLVIKIKDEYNQNGTFKIYLEMTNKLVKATYYRGEFIDGLFYPKKYIILNNTETTGYLELRKTSNTGKNYVGIIAEILTSLGNKYLVYKRVDLPYNNLQ